MENTTYKAKKYKILFVGDTSVDMYVKAFYNAAKQNQEIRPLLMGFDKLNISNNRNNIFLRIERHYKVGPHVDQINRRLIRIVKQEQVDIVFLYTCDIIRPRTVKKISKMCYVAIYNNDNPFSDYYPKYMWNNMICSLKYANIVYSFRKSNIKQYIDNGAKCAKLMRGYYIKERNFYIEDSSIDLDIPDVCYIGHYEDDGRAEYIRVLLEAGIDVGVSKDFEVTGMKHEHLKYISDTHPRYNEVLNKAKIAIVFLSNINKDTYTTRNFEIPVVKTMMVTPGNDDIATLFIDGKEAIFYYNKIDFLDKIKYYLEHEDERLEVALAGYDRVIRDGHAADDRIEEIINDFKEYNE
ncbi:glycosyltransferase [Butyrivibrio fibrisolvens]|uniref:glycosyltransferase family protein n=1 Tax=Butyrivibrio fibrisolvens TaxID=831 RepID=UPI00040F1171|nr:glycosyltransferase [Butyrivibrio fibrisolvens]